LQNLNSLVISNVSDLDFKETCLNFVLYGLLSNPITCLFADRFFFWTNVLCQLYRLNSLAHLSEGILEIVFYLDIYIVDKFCCSTGVMFGTEHYYYYYYYYYY